MTYRDLTKALLLLTLAATIATMALGVARGAAR